MKSSADLGRKVIHFMNEKNVWIHGSLLPKTIYSEFLDKQSVAYDFGGYMVGSWRRWGILAEGCNIIILRNIFEGYKTQDD